MTYLAERYLLARPPLPTYTVTATATATGASPNSVSTTGVVSGNLCFYAMTTTNSVPNVAGPQGGGWTELWREDSASSEIGTCWYKIAGGSEPATWDWTHSAGTLATSVMIALDTPHTTLLDNTARVTSQSTSFPDFYIPGFETTPKRGLFVTGVHISNNANGAVLVPLPVVSSTQNSQTTHLGVGRLATLSNAPFGATEVLAANAGLLVTGGAVFA